MHPRIPVECSLQGSWHATAATRGITAAIHVMVQWYISCTGMLLTIHTLAGLQQWLASMLTTVRHGTHQLQHQLQHTLPQLRPRLPQLQHLPLRSVLLAGGALLALLLLVAAVKYARQQQVSCFLSSEVAQCPQLIV